MKRPAYEDPKIETEKSNKLKCRSSGILQDIEKIRGYFTRIPQITLTPFVEYDEITVET